MLRFVYLMFFAGSAWTLNAGQLFEKDLALLFPLENDQPILVGDASVFPEDWLQVVSDAYRLTAVGSTLDFENRPEDWRLVSLRIVPCSPLGSFPEQDIDELCWPEIRQVWQPVLQDVFIKWNVRRDFYADDRAIHALYDVHLPEQAATTQAMVQRLRERLRSAGGEQGLDPAFLQQFRQERDAAIRGLLQDTLALRQASATPSRLVGLDIRPESYESVELKELNRRLLALFKRYAPSYQLKALTSFSLPEGRTPAASDEWVFLSFSAEQGRLIQENITVDLKGPMGFRLDIGRSESASMSRDDSTIYDLLQGDETLANFLRQNLLLFINDRRDLEDPLADRRQFLVPNTSCASCHKFNELRFNFHNFSYLEDLPASIAPRTRRDVELDLQWLRERPDLGF